MNRSWNSPERARTVSASSRTGRRAHRASYITRSCPTPRYAAHPGVASPKKPLPRTKTSTPSSPPAKAPGFASPAWCLWALSKADALAEIAAIRSVICQGVQLVRALSALAGPMPAVTGGVRRRRRLGLPHGTDIGEQIRVGQHHSFGMSRTTRGVLQQRDVLARERRGRPSRTASGTVTREVTCALSRIRCGARGVDQYFGWQSLDHLFDHWHIGVLGLPPGQRFRQEPGAFLGDRCLVIVGWSHVLRVGGVPGRAENLAGS